MKIEPSRQAKQLKYSQLLDRVAKGVIVSGGFLVILTVIAILVEIVKVAVPLFFSPDSKQSHISGLSLPDGAEIAEALGDEYMEAITLIDKSGVAHIFSEQGGTFKKIDRTFPILDDGSQLVAHVKNGDQVLLQDAGGQIHVYQTKVRSVFDEQNQRTQIATPTLLAKFEGFPENQILLSGGLNSAGDLFAVFSLNGNEYWLEFRPAKAAGGLGFGLGGNSQKVASREPLTVNSEKTGYHAAFSDSFTRLALAGAYGQVHLFELDKSSGAILSKTDAYFEQFNQLTAVAFSLGGDSILIGDEAGNLAALFILSDGLKLAKNFSKHKGAIEGLVPSRRSKQFLAYDRNGGIGFHFLTNERTLLQLQNEFKPHAVVMSPKDQALVTLSRNVSEANKYELYIPHPEISFSSLFSKVWYESYQMPAFVWQSTGGSDSFESKMSLVPLIFGTLKATFYAMLFALPIAVFAAIYTSQFMGQRYRKRIKPLVELMASIPSVVIGFLLALWLAPFLEKWLVSFFILLLLGPSLLGLVLYILAKVPRETLLRKWTAGREFVFIIPILVVAGYIATLSGPVVEVRFFGGMFSQWIYEHLGMTLDQRNSIVVAIGLGFAVIPIIFSISDDSLSSVPANLSASSFALGASRWQTVWRVVIPSASPGIFAASMIGFGRAVGETMIVLMATGNTPILNWSVFNGMRTLSANIAVEIPEAPVDSSLYRTLFLCAVILFAFTFSINTIAELVRARLRKKYGRF